MRVGLDDATRERVDATAALLAGVCDVEALRATWAAAGAPSRERWARLAALGLTTVAVPESVGGLGGGDLDLVPLLEEVGFAALPEPLVDAIVAARLLAETAPGHAEPLVAGLGDARVLATAGLDASPYVAHGADADVVVLGVDDGVHLVERGALGWVAQPCVDGSQRLATPDPRTVLPPPVAHDAGAVGRAGERARLGRAAMLLGLGRRCLALGVEHATHRHQFGRPIGAYQALRHRLADDWTAIEFARPLVWRAAWSLDRDADDAGLHVAMAMSAACDAASSAARTAVQVHGAMGYTFECDVHLFLKRTLVLTTTHGDARTHRRRVVSVLRARDPGRAP